MELNGKNAVVYGAGASGIAAYELLCAKGAKAIIFDDDPNVGRATNSVGVFSDADIVVLSPGVSAGKDFLLDAKLENKIVISELELASRFCMAEQIAVTGTNGKTTTTMLIDAIFRRAGMPSYAVGNIGTPFSSIADRLDATDIAVIEASSFQLESSLEFSPDTAVLLNITPDHLDRHGSMQKYIAAKSNIFRAQGEQDVVIYNDDDDAIRGLLPDMVAKKVPFSISHPVKGGAYISSDFVCFDARPIACVEDMDLRGRELENVLAATAVAMEHGITPYTIAAALGEFSRPAFRRQLLGSKDGIKVFNDSKATNVFSTLAACESMDGPSVLIVGGAKRAENFSELFSGLPAKIKAIVVCGENGEDILRAARLAGYENISSCENLERALDRALHEARTNGLKNILFSPASKSFDAFDNYEERGKFFSAVAKEMGVRKS